MTLAYGSKRISVKGYLLVLKCLKKQVFPLNVPTALPGYIHYGYNTLPSEVRNNLREHCRATSRKVSRREQEEYPHHKCTTKDKEGYSSSSVRPISDNHRYSVTVQLHCKHQQERFQHLNYLRKRKTANQTVKLIFIAF